MSSPPAMRTSALGAVGPVPGGADPRQESDPLNESRRWVDILVTQ